MIRVYRGKNWRRNRIRTDEGQDEEGGKGDD
jgi:hypothetical protein